MSKCLAPKMRVFCLHPRTVTRFQSPSLGTNRTLVDTPKEPIAEGLESDRLTAYIYLYLSGGLKTHNNLVDCWSETEFPESPPSRPRSVTSTLSRADLCCPMQNDGLTSGRTILVEETEQSGDRFGRCEFVDGRRVRYTSESELTEGTRYTIVVGRLDSLPPNRLVLRISRAAEVGES